MARKIREAAMSVQEGGCRCARVRFAVTGGPLLTMACHCTGCQRMTGSAYSLSALYPAAAFEVTRGEPVIGGLRGEARHYFCAFCMSWMFTRLEEPGLVNVRATMFDEIAGWSPFIETYTSEMLPWASTPAAHRFARFPEMSAFPGLMAEFAGREE